MGILGILLSVSATTTVKVSARTSKQLDALQARVRVQRGRRVTKQALLEELVDRALDESELLVLLRAPKRPLSPRARKALLEYPVPWGVATSEEDIDAILYGEEP